VNCERNPARNSSKASRLKGLAATKAKSPAATSAAESSSRRAGEAAPGRSHRAATGSTSAMPPLYLVAAARPASTAETSSARALPPCRWRAAQSRLAATKKTMGTSFTP
jgi:hypothetical protein